MDASRLAIEVLNSNYYSHGSIVYNKFKTVVSYQCSPEPIFSEKTVEAAEKLFAYDSLNIQVLQDYLEYWLGSLVFYSMKETACSEQSARMSAMDNASKNAGEMIEKLILTFNRTRQSVNL